MGRYEDEYDDYDDYDMDGEEEGVEGEGEEEEYEEEEERQPTEQELEYLELRQRLKESIRQKAKKEGGSLGNGKEKQKLPYNNFGSFFGPSRPVIAQRVISESKSLLENKQLVSKMLEAKSNKKVNPASNGTGSKPGPTIRAPKISEVKRKVERLKQARDYSFLSDDAELPVPAKQPPPRSISAPSSDARPANIPLKSQQSLGNGSRNIQGAREERKPVPSNGKVHSKSGSHAPSSSGRPNSTSVDSRRQLNVNNGFGPGRPAGAKPLPAKTSFAAMERKAPAPSARNPPPNMHRPQSSKMPLSNSRQGIEQRNGSQEHRNGSQEYRNNKVLPKKPVPPSTSKQATPSSMVKRPAPSSSMSKQPAHSSMSKRPVPSSMSRQPPPSSMSRNQINKPLRQAPSHAPPRTQPKPKRKPPPSDDDIAMRELRKMLGSKHRGGYSDDEDLDCMEVGFDDIMKEERRSAKIARKEDEEQLRLIEEEERKERMKKKRRLGH